MQNFFRFWFPLLGYSGIIFYVSSIPSLQAPPLFPHADKVFHAGEYTIFGFLAVRAFLKYQDFGLNHYLTIGFASSLIYAITDEFHQSFVPGRSADLYDVVFDCLGGVLGAYIFSMFVKITRKYNNVNH